MTQLPPTDHTADPTADPTASAWGAIDYQLAFDMAPVGMVLSRQRTIVDCNAQLCAMFGASKQELLGQSFVLLYPSAHEYERMGERIAPLLNAHGVYADDRIMRRVGGRLRGETFWCHVTGRALHREQPHAAGIWTFEDLAARQPVQTNLTPREREVAAVLLEGLTSKAIGRALSISHRTVEIYRTQLLRKYEAQHAGDLLKKLLRGQTS